MAEYIDRKALGIGKCNPDVFENKGYAEGWNSAIEIIENAPAADVVEVKHGKWYRHDKKTHGDTCYHCSQCEKMPLTDCGMVWELTPYCPFCGVKMDGGKENEQA